MVKDHVVISKEWMGPKQHNINVVQRDPVMAYGLAVIFLVQQNSALNVDFNML